MLLNWFYLIVVRCYFDVIFKMLYKNNYFTSLFWAFVKIYLMLPEFQFSIRSITWAQLTPGGKNLLWPDCTLSWPLLMLLKGQPTGDPVDSDHCSKITLGSNRQSHPWRVLLPCWWTLTVFTHLACIDCLVVFNILIGVTLPFIESIPFNVVDVVGE